MAWQSLGIFWSLRLKTGNFIQDWQSRYNGLSNRECVTLATWHLSFLQRKRSLSSIRPSPHISVDAKFSHTHLAILSYVQAMHGCTLGFGWQSTGKALACVLSAV